MIIKNCMISHWVEFIFIWELGDMYRQSLAKTLFKLQVDNFLFLNWQNSMKNASEQSSAN